MWVKAGLLTPGMTLLDDQGHPVTLLSTHIQLLPNGIQVYNLEVDTDHTYFILGEDGVPVWVHNGGCTEKTNIGTKIHASYRAMFEKMGWNVGAIKGGKLIPDAWKIFTRGETLFVKVRELKPFNTRAIDPGAKQAANYAREIIKAYARKNPGSAFENIKIEIIVDTYLR